MALWRPVADSEAGHVAFGSKAGTRGRAGDAVGADGGGKAPGTASGGPRRAGSPPQVPWGRRQVRDRL